MTNKPTPEGETTASKPDPALAAAEKRCATCWGECGKCVLDELREATNQPSPARSDMLEAERAKFESLIVSAWSLETMIDGDGDEVYVEDWVQGAWVGYQLAASTPTAGGAQERASLETTAAIVATWPKWKQSVTAERAPSGEIYAEMLAHIETLTSEPDGQEVLEARNALPRYRAALARRATAGTTEQVAAVDALDGLGYTYDSEIGWLPPKRVAGTTAAPSSETANVIAGFTEWMRDTSHYPHNDDRRKPFDAFDAGAAWASRATAGNAAPTEAGTPLLTNSEILELLVHVRPEDFGLSAVDPNYEGYDLACARLVEAEVAARCRAEGGVTCTTTADAGRSAAAPGDLPPLPKAERELIELHQPATYTTHVCTSARFTADQMREYGKGCWALGRGAAVREYILTGTVSNAGAAPGWIRVEDRPPEGECLAVYVTPNGKQRLIRAKYARQYQIEAEGDDCETEYNEDDDTFYIKAGWLECIDNWGEYSSCCVTEGTVTHWMPLPASPVGAKEKE